MVTEAVLHFICMRMVSLKIIMLGKRDYVLDKNKINSLLLISKKVQDALSYFVFVNFNS